MSCVCSRASKSGSNLPESPSFLSVRIALRTLKVFYKHLITAAFDSKPGSSHSSASSKVCENDIPITERREGLTSTFSCSTLPQLGSVSIAAEGVTAPAAKTVMGV